MAMPFKYKSKDRSELIKEIYFRNKNKKVITKDDCWLFTGSLNHNGYGKVRCKQIAGRSSILFHRVVAEFKFGPFEKSLSVCHKCDTPSCFNPDHLFIGTHKQNMNDAFEKNRFAFGLRLPQTKLSFEDIKKIRVLLSIGKKQLEIAKKFSVDQSVISRIKTGDRGVGKRVK